VVATPIGNLEDITVRGLHLLKSVGLIAAEDTRRTRILLGHYGIETALLSYHDRSAPGRLEHIIGVLRGGTDVALVTDAGSPGISDPGYPLLRECATAGITIIPVPGPSAVIAALTASALPTDRFTFAGFLPRREGARRRVLGEHRDRPETLVLFESPHRVEALLRDILHVFGDRQAALCRELTKAFEDVRRGMVSELLSDVVARSVRGEVALVIAGLTRHERRRRGESLSECAGSGDEG
jgi:16S rRNA (cytidine1402-2'-O)-methyltransferase